MFLLFLLSCCFVVFSCFLTFFLVILSLFSWLNFVRNVAFFVFFREMVKARHLHYIDALRHVVFLKLALFAKIWLKKASHYSRIPWQILVNVFESCLSGRCFEGYEPKWFTQQKDPQTGNMIHTYQGKYWESKGLGEWSYCPDIFWSALPSSIGCSAISLWFKLVH
jgi:hypothetical protein